MKKMFLVIVLILLLLLAGYYGTGFLAERSIKHTMATLETLDKLHLKLIKYHRGFFCSHATLQWSFHVPPQEVANPNGGTQTIPATDYVIPAPLTVLHGPVIFTPHGLKFGLGYANSQLDIPKTYVEQIKNYLGDSSVLPTLKLSLLVHFRDRATLKYDVPSFQLMLKPKQTQVDWLGLNGMTKLSFELDQVNGKSALEGIQVSQGTTQLSLGKVESQYDLHKTDLGLYEGMGQVDVTSLQLSMENRSRFDLSGLSVGTDCHVEEGLFNAHFSGQLHQMSIDGQNYGPAVLDMSLQNLDAAVMVRIQSQLQSIQQASLSERQKVLFGLIPELPRLFAKGARLTVSKLRFVMPEGELMGRLNLSLPQGELRNPFQIAAQLTGEGHLQIPAALVQTLVSDAIRQKLQQQPQPAIDQTATAPSEPVVLQGDALEQQVTTLSQKRLSSLLASGALVLHDKDYVLDVKLAQGRVTVNGKPFTPSMFEW